MQNLNHIFSFARSHQPQHTLHLCAGESAQPAKWTTIITMQLVQAPFPFKHGQFDHHQPRPDIPRCAAATPTKRPSTTINFRCNSSLPRSRLCGSWKALASGGDRVRPWDPDPTVLALRNTVTLIAPSRHTKLIADRRGRQLPSVRYQRRSRTAHWTLPERGCGRQA